MLFRIEKDSLGQKKIPQTAYWGIHTQRGVENFPISGQRPDPLFIQAYALLKYAGAKSNAVLGLLDKKRAQAIAQAAREIAQGKFNDQFVIDVFQAGAGTSLHMNLNEVIANRALEILGRDKGDYQYLHPNDHVNMSQSTNDTFPTALRLALLSKLPKFYSATLKLTRTFAAKGKEFDPIIKAARTHLQDAVPIRLGQEFTAYGRTLQKALNNIKKNAQALTELGIGGTAAGTGLNTHPAYRSLVIKYLNQVTQSPLKGSANLIEIMQSQQAFSQLAGALKNFALELNRIARDLKLLASGPAAGLKEITLPTVQPGSSIMPGKVNPSILECVQMVCLRAIGAEATVSLAVGNGELNLNIFLPLVADELLSALKILTKALEIMEQKCLRGIKANLQVCQAYAWGTPSMATILNPLIGYDAAAKIFQEAIRTSRPVPEIILKKGLLTKKQVKKIFNVKRLTQPGLPAW